MDAPLVLLKRAILRETGITLLTLIRTLTSMRPHVLQECLFAVETPITILDLALKLVLVL